MTRHFVLVVLLALSGLASEEPGAQPRLVEQTADSYRIGDRVDPDVWSSTGLALA